MSAVIEAPPTSQQWLLSAPAHLFKEGGGGLAINNGRLSGRPGPITGALSEDRTARGAGVRNGRSRGSDLNLKPGRGRGVQRRRWEPQSTEPDPRSGLYVQTDGWEIGDRFERKIGN